MLPNREYLLGAWLGPDLSGRVTAVLAPWASRGEQAASLSRAEAGALVRRLDRARLVGVHRLVAGAVPRDFRRQPDGALEQEIVGAIETGALLIARGWDWVDGREDVQSAESHVARRVMAGRARLPFEGSTYRLLPSEAWAWFPDRGGYHVVPRQEAVTILARMATQASPEQRLALEAAHPLVVDTPSVTARAGIFLLRLIPLPAFVADSAPPLTPSQVSRVQKKAFELLLLEDGSSAPLTQVPLRVRTPDGAEREVRTDGDGRVRIPDVDPGTCEVTSVIAGARVCDCYAVAPRGPAVEVTAPARAGHVVADVVEHRVRTGETPQSIAAGEGVAWDAIARFNWGTTDPDELERHYRDTLGCTKKSPQGQYSFDDQDEPGILLVPKPWEATFKVGGVHEVALRPLRTVFLSLRTERDLAVPGAAYEVELADGTRREGKLGRSGIARLAGVPDGPFSVSYPDELEVLAHSLAASIRHAFDEQATGPLFHLLMQEPEVVTQVAAAYDQYFNDLSGDGLWADVDDVVTDPDARRPLLALCSLAGAPVARASLVSVRVDGGGSRE